MFLFSSSFAQHCHLGYLGTRCQVLGPQVHLAARVFRFVMLLQVARLSVRDAANTTNIGLFAVVAAEVVLQVATLVEPLVATVDFADEEHLVFLRLGVVHLLDLVVLARHILEGGFSAFGLGHRNDFRRKRR